MSGHNVNTGNKGQYNKAKSKMSPEELRVKKPRIRCVNCNKYGHWQNDHAQDGSDNFDFPSLYVPGNPDNVNKDNKQQQGSTYQSQKISSNMKFCMVNFIGTYVSS